jgi:hypothetical protein
VVAQEEKPEPESSGENTATMSKRTIFVSCGQYTREEKALGKAIVEMVDKIPGLKAYFAEEAQDLNGLVSNILGKLNECDAFITVMHHRGAVSRPSASPISRASVWIEQEIAIATYIRHIEKRPLPVIAFKHRSVGLEGIRTLVQLNPIEFTHEEEVLAALPDLLERWKGLPATGISVEVTGSEPVRRDGHELRNMTFSIANDTGARIREITGQLRIPAGLLKHSTGHGLNVINGADSHYCVLRFDETNTGVIQPHTKVKLPVLEYCIKCAIDEIGDAEFIAALALAEREVEITVWVDGKEYQQVKTMKGLSMRGRD